MSYFWSIEFNILHPPKHHNLSSRIMELALLKETIHLNDSITKLYFGDFTTPIWKCVKPFLLNE